MISVRSPTRIRLLFAVLATVACAGACAAGPPQPAALDTANDACARCRMTVSDRRFASQVVSPGDETLFFDDLGCLREYLARASLAEEALVYVTDHRTRQWVIAHDAVFTRRPGIATPMGSSLLAHASASSRDQDGAARGGMPVPAAEILGRRLAGGGH